jgi:glyoxylase-like metal-dependent hydrolase (beta-lactamase superfamily II)
MHQVTAGLKDGEIIDVQGVVVQAFAIPGHTEGSAAYLVKDVLFLGDSVTAESSGKLRSAHWVTSDDVARAELSVKALAKKLQASEVNHLAFSHSGPLAGFQPLMAYAQEP